MIVLAAFFPTQSSGGEDPIESELRHYIAVARAKAHRSKTLVITEDWWRLEGCVRHYLDGAFRGLRVQESSWKTPRKLRKMLYGLWDIEDKQTRDWRELLRNHCETIDDCPSCGFLRDPGLNDAIRLPVDHYLPRSHWPELSIVATNLVPICDTCNSRLKFSDAPKGGALRMYLHPYFDRFIERVALRARVDDGRPPLLSFHLEQGDVTDEEFNVANSHFRLLHLSERYVRRFAQDTLPSIRATLRLVLIDGGVLDAASVTAELASRLRSARLARPERHWEVAALSHVAASSAYARWLLDDVEAAHASGR